MTIPQPIGTEAEVCNDIAERQRRGIAKYGTTVADNPAALAEWLQHAYEECLDQAVYLKRALSEEQALTNKEIAQAAFSDREQYISGPYMLSRKRRYYGASKVKYAPFWRDLRASGVDIISTWIDEAGEGQTADYCELSERCIAEIRNADAVILYSPARELLKGALIEVGAALAIGKPVLCVGARYPFVSRVFVEHPLWRTFATIDQAIAAPLALSRESLQHPPPPGETGSETPRTDAEIRRIYSNMELAPEFGMSLPGQIMLHARTLERELREEKKVLHQALRVQDDQERELAALREKVELNDELQRRIEAGELSEGTAQLFKNILATLNQK